jgi:hypothetical protein
VLTIRCISQVAAILAEVLGREIIYKVISVEEKIKRYVQMELPEDYSSVLVQIEKTLDDGFDVKNAADPRAVKGKVGIREWIEKNKAAFV